MYAFTKLSNQFEGLELKFLLTLFPFWHASRFEEFGIAWVDVLCEGLEFRKFSIGDTFGSEFFAKILQSVSDALRG